ncbi:MAG TPA: hypothetical protein VGL05_28000 [Kribbella sp.]
MWDYRDALDQLTGLWTRNRAGGPRTGTGKRKVRRADPRTAQQRDEKQDEVPQDHHPGNCSRLTKPPRMTPGRPAT